MLPGTAVATLAATMAVGYDNDGYVVGDPKDQNYNTKGWTSERPQLSDEEIRKEKRRILKNVIVISFSFMLLFTAFQSMANLQSSINKVRSRLDRCLGRM